MSTFDKLGELLSGTPDDVASAWREAGALFAKLAKERDSGALADELTDDRQAEIESVLFQQIREALAAEGKSSAEYVIFPTMEWDNGSFLTRAAEIFIDGEAEEFEFPDAVEESLTDRYGCVGESAGLGLHLRTKHFDFDDYIDNVRDWLSDLVR